MTNIPSDERVWGGRTLADRRAGRRTRLLEAGLDLISAGGTQSATVRAVCRQAGLTERYFYESFRDRDQFTTELFDEVAGRCVDAIVSATTGASAKEVAAAAVEAVVEFALDDLRLGRLLFVASSTDPLLLAKRDQMIPVVTGLIRARVPDTASEAHRDLVAASMLGALANLFLQYVAGGLEVSRDEFVAHCVRLLRTLSTMPPG